jgi:hypothetical protein
MDWVKWLIPLVVVFVIILSTLARITQEEKKRLPPRPRPGGEGDGPGRPRRSPSEIDRFLQEVNRRRREASEHARPVVKERPVTRRPVSERPVRRETPSPSQDIPSAVPPTPRTPTPAPVVLMPTTQPSAVVAEVVAAKPSPAAPAGSVTPGPSAAVVAAKPQTPTAVHLRQQLKNPQTLRTALVLREVLDGPLCRRRRSLFRAR